MLLADSELDDLKVSGGSSSPESIFSRGTAAASLALIDSMVSSGA